MDKLVSIILPAYNGAHRISDAIQSVTNQSYTNWELLIIDDFSVDNTREVVSNFVNKDSRIKYIKNNTNLGLQKTLNIGLAQSKGEYIARIDDDDMWADVDKLQKQVDFMDNNPDYVLLGTGVIIINEQGNELFRYLLPQTNEQIKNRILGKNCFAHSSVMFRKSIVMQFGGYSEGEEAKYMEDYDLWLKLGSVGKLANLPIYGLKYTMRGGSLTAVHKAKVFKKMLSHIKKYRYSHKGYYGALIRAYVRYFLYSIYIKFAKKLPLYKIIKFYKEM
jgi:glycosyltransferase involved in cell wall biosynthesis